MEGLAVAGGVIAVVSIAGQVVQGCSYICHVLDSAITAPEEIRLLSSELKIIERIVRDSLDDRESRDALDFCNEAVTKLRSIIDKYAEIEEAGKYRKWGKRLSMALSKEKIHKHLSRLAAGKTYLRDVQNQSTWSSNLAQSHKMMQSIQQLADSHIDSTIVLARTEREIEELSRITKDTKFAINQLASQILDGGQGNRQRDDWCIQRIEATLRQLFSQHISSANVESKSNPIGDEQVVKRFAVVPKLQSELDRRIADLMGWGKKAAISEYDSEYTTDMDKSSKYKMWLGEVYMRIIAITYQSANEMKSSKHFWGPSNVSNPTNFPATFTKAEVLLRPKSWIHTRALTISCRQTSEPSHTALDISFDIAHFECGQPSNSSGQQCDSIIATKPTTRTNSFPALEQRLKTSSQSLLYTAFKASYIAAKIFGTRRPNTRHVVMKKSIARNSFDCEIDDVMEIIQLWINTDFEEEFYRHAFPGDMTQTADQSVAQFQEGNRNRRSFQKLRHEYVFELVVKMTELMNERVSIERDDVNVIHDCYWEQCQSLALASTLCLKTSIYDILWQWPISRLIFTRESACLFLLFLQDSLFSIRHTMRRTRLALLDFLQSIWILVRESQKIQVMKSIRKNVILETLREVTFYFNSVLRIFAAQKTSDNHMISIIETIIKFSFSFIKCMR